MLPRITAQDGDSAMSFLLSRIDYERVITAPYGQSALKLDRMRALLAPFGDPQAKFPIAHIAGTKGKGSTAAMLASILTASGLRTGLFSSPHLWRVEERIAIDGRPCASGELAATIQRLRPVVAELDRQAADESPPGSGPTYFEILTAAALVHFAEQRVDFAVLEVGMGGRLDSTNVCSPELTIVTNISFDHMKQLGNSLALIAVEKAGIIKPGVPAISGVIEPEPRDVIRRIAAERGAPLSELSRDFDFVYRPPVGEAIGEGDADGRVDAVGQVDADRRASFHFLPHHHPGRGAESTRFVERRDLPLPLLGRHQAANAAIAVAAVDQLRQRGWSISEAAIRAGLSAVVWPARLEVIHRSPTIVLDAAHNVASVEALVASIEESFPQRPRRLVFATTKDKEIVPMLRRLLPRFEQVILTRYRNNPRGVPVDELASLVAGIGAANCRCAETPDDAWELIRRDAAPEQLIVVAGSFFIAAEMRTAIDAAPLLGR